MSQVTIGKWGSNLAIRFPSRDREGGRACRRLERVELEAHDGNIVIRRAVPHFTVAELFRGQEPRQMARRTTGEPLSGDRKSVAARSWRNDDGGGLCP